MGQLRRPHFDDARRRPPSSASGGYGITGWNKDSGEPEARDVVFYPANCIMPPEGQTGIEWLEAGMPGCQLLTPALPGGGRGALPCPLLEKEGGGKYTCNYCLPCCWTGLLCIIPVHRQRRVSPSSSWVMKILNVAHGGYATPGVPTPPPISSAPHRDGLPRWFGFLIIAGSALAVGIVLGLLIERIVLRRLYDHGKKS